MRAALRLHYTLALIGASGSHRGRFLNQPHAGEGADMAQFNAFGLPVVVWIMLAALSSAAEPQLHTGVVVSASRDTLVIKDKSGKQQTFSVDPAIKVTVNGKPGKLEDLKETMPVQVMMDEKGKVLAVSTIDKEKHNMEKHRVLVAITAAAPSRSASL
jgi:hypothetical protein